MFRVVVLLGLLNGRGRYSLVSELSKCLSSGIARHCWWLGMLHSSGTDPYFIRLRDNYQGQNPFGGFGFDSIKDLGKVKVGNKSSLKHA
jgi:hypothetical protein